MTWPAKLTYESMKFITRELYDSMQGGSDLSDEERNRRWHDAFEAYRVELEKNKALLPESMQAFADVTLHDAVVKDVSQPSADTICLKIDATKNPWGPTGYFRLTFTGVKLLEGADEICGDEWLYEEVHPHDDAGFDYRVLLWQSQFRVLADEVEFEEVDLAESTNTK